jgi:hypothetical protein
MKRRLGVVAMLVALSLALAVRQYVARRAML